MNDLIGFNEAAKHVVTEIGNHLTSAKPYWGFGIWGSRRSGRSTFFEAVNKYLNDDETLPVKSFVGELVHTTPEGFEEALLKSITEGKQCQDYTSFKGNVRSKAGFFELCATINQEEGKVPVFLIDMGKSLEQVYRKKGLGGIDGLQSLLRRIFNDLVDEQRAPLALGIGVTPEFVEMIESSKAGGDVFIQRYQPLRKLDNISLEGEVQGEAFREIVKKMSGLDIPDQYSGLWRGKVVTPGQLGENLQNSGCSTVTSQTLWGNLCGKWDILSDNQHEEIPPSDLGELLLVDAVISDNRYPDYLEACEGGYRANDQLYNHFGFLSPRRDPSTIERFKRQIDDPEENEVAAHLLSNIGQRMKQLGLTNISEAEDLGQKSALMEAQVNEHSDHELNALEKELYQFAFPRKLITVLCLTSNPPQDIIQQKIKEYAELNYFILILCKEGVSLGSTSLGRYLESLKTVKSESVALEMMTHLLSDPSEVSLDEINNWIIGTLVKLFSQTPPLCLKHDTIRQLISGAISSGVLSINKFSQQINASISDVNRCLKLLVNPQIVSKKGSTVTWDPDRDVILDILLECNGIEEEIIEQIQTLYAINRVNINDVSSLYQCISGDQGLSGITKDNVLKHAKGNQDYQLDIIGDYLKRESDLKDEYTAKYESYKDRELVEIEEVIPHLNDILKLLADVQKEIEANEERRERVEEELKSRKTALIQILDECSEYFETKEIDEFKQTVEAIRTLDSRKFSEIERKIEKRKTSVDNLKDSLIKLRIRLEAVKSISSETDSTRFNSELQVIEDLVDNYNITEANDRIQEIDKQLNKLEELEEEIAILSGETVSSGSPTPTSGDTSGRSGTPVPPPAPGGISGDSGTPVPPPAPGGISGDSGTPVPPPAPGGISGDSGTPVPPPAPGGISGDSGTPVPPPAPGGISGDSGTPVPPPAPGGISGGTVEETEKVFDLADLEQRKTLAKTLVQYKQKISKIYIEVDSNASC